jgi:hypothetical protein
MGNVVRSRIQPQLIRKRTVIPIPNISIVVEPSRAKAKSLKDLAQDTPIKKPIPRQVVKPPTRIVRQPSISNVVSKAKHTTKPAKLKRAKVRL